MNETPFTEGTAKKASASVRDFRGQGFFVNMSAAAQPPVGEQTSH